MTAADPATQSFIHAYNKALPGEIKRRADSRHRVMVSDFRSITAADLTDIYSTDTGCQKMADIWFKGSQEVSKKDWIKANDDSLTEEYLGCAKTIPLMAYQHSI